MRRTSEIMNTNRTKRIITIVAVVQIVMIMGLLALPTLVQAIPGRYRVALAERSPFLSGIAEGVMDQVAPVATALPAPSIASAEQIDIASLVVTRPTLVADPPTPTQEPTATAEIVATEAVEEETAVQPTAIPSPTAEPTATPEPTPEPLPAQVVLEGMGRIQQTFNNCGPANLTQVLNFHDYDITQEDVRLVLKPNSEDRNVSPWQIQDFVNEQTPFQAIARTNGTQEMIKQFIAAGLPVVVEKGYSLPESGWWGHYITIYGYDDGQEKFYTQDTYLAPLDDTGRPLPYADLDEFWKQFNYTFYVVYEPLQEEIVHNILGEAMLDNFTMWQLTANRALQETESEPYNPFVWFNLGAALTEMAKLTGEAQYYQAGAQAFDKSRVSELPPRMLWYQFQPYWAYWKIGRIDDMLDLADATLATQGGRNVEETFWFQGHALLEKGDLSGARTAYEEALRVNENFSPAQISLDYVISLGG
jgi:hypothetical protein